ncbi:MAG: restriction endonuclease subunit S [Leptospira sp.]|nr:restriction endonuclease subunit S [Leptospira sp.]
MSEWKEYQLSEVIEKFIDYRGKTPTKTTHGIPLITAKIVKEGKILEANEFISENDYNSWMTRGLPEINDVVLTTEAPLGEVALIKDKKVALAQRIITLRGKKEKIENVFLKYYFQSKDGQHELQSRASGTTVFGIKSSVLQEVPILLPPLAEQKAIAGVLSALDDKIDLLHRQNKTLEAMAEALFRQWFVEEAEESWEEGKLGDLGTIITGKTPNTENSEFWDGELDFITPTDYKNFGKYAVCAMRTLAKKIKSNHQNLILPKGSILVTCIGSDMGKVTININECLTNQQINSIILKDRDLYSEYTYQYLRHIYDELRNIAHGGTTMPIINKSTFSNILIPIPPNKKLKSYAEITMPVNEKIVENSLEIRSLEKLRDVLLPKLMSGEVRVEV